MPYDLPRELYGPGRRAWKKTPGLTRDEENAPEVGDQVDLAGDSV